MKSVAIALICLSFLTGCAKEPFSTLICPEIVQYSKNTQKEAARELTNPTNNIPVLIEFITDYSVLRDETRACHGKEVTYNGR